MKHLKLFFALFAMLALGVGNAWAETIFSDNFANVGNGSNTEIKTRDGWSGFSKCYAQGNSGLRLGSSSAGGSITKTAMSSISGTKDIKVTIYTSRYNTNANNFTISCVNGTISSITGVGTLSSGKVTISPSANAGVTSTTAGATWKDDFKTEMIISASSSTTITFATNRRAILGPVTIEEVSSGGGDEPETPTPSVSVSPASHTFATTNVGETATQVFEITAKNTTETLSAEISNTTDYAISDIADNKITVTYQPQTAETHEATLTIKAGDEASATVTLSGKAVAALEGTWALVTDASSLKAGDKIIIAAKDYDVALGTTQANNNRPEVAIKKNGNTITATSEAQVLTLQAGNQANTLALYTGSGYLYAASSSSNYLRTETNLSDNSSWDISIADGTATLTAQGNYTRNTMFYNLSSKIFACYASTTTNQKAIALYKKVDESEVLAPGFTPTGGTFYGAQSVEITCATAGAEIYYTLDGSAPTSSSTKYTTAISISETKTLKAIAIKGENSSSVTEATYTILAPLTTMDQIFAKATAVGSTPTSVEITFGNWVVSAVKEDGKTAFVTDGTKGFVIYEESCGFNVGDVLSGTAACKVLLYNGFAELTGLTSSTTGLTVSTGGTITTQELDATAIEALTGVNTGSLIKINGICSSSDSKYYVAGVQIYTALYDFETLKVGAEYNITGIYQPYNSTKEMLPRSAEDIEEVVGLPTATIEVSNITMEVGQEKAIEATITPDAAQSTVQYAITSGNEYITLSGTTITAVAAGTATITATIAEKADEYKGATKEFTVTVKPQNIAILPFTFNDGKADIEKTLGMSQTGLDDDYNSAPKLKFNGAGDNVIIHFDSQAGEFSFLLKQNGQNAGTFTVYESANGEDYTPIWSGGDLGGNGQSATIEPTLSPTARYVKFEYTTKGASTNYALGSISIQKVDHRAEAGIAWNPATVSLTVGDAFTAPTLVNPHSVADITYESSNDAVATVTDGVIELAGAAGTATITAYFAGDATYKPATVTCTITVKELPDVCDGSDDFADDQSEEDAKYYATRTTIAGWVATNAARITIDDDTYFAINGKTSAVGTITSPVLNGGIGSIKIRYANTYSENNGVSFKLDIKQNDEVVKTYTVTKAKAEVVQNTVYTELIENINVEGDFQMVFTNLSPSNDTGNKDRVSIGRLCWTGYEEVVEEPTTATVTVEDPIGSMSTYTGVEENDGVWSKVCNIGEEVTIGIDELGEGWLFAYWTVGSEKIFTETYTFTVTEDITITANYGMAMDVEFDNMELDQESWVVTAGPEAGFGIELTLGIDVEGEHPKGFGLVEGSSISLGGNELELVTGYFTSVDLDAPSAEAVVFAIHEEMLMAFVCTMTAAPAPTHNIVVENATIDNQTGKSGFLFMNGTWSDGTETYPVKAEIPGFDVSVASATYAVTVTVGGQGDEDPWLGSAEGEATVTVNNGLVTLTGSLANAWTGFKADVTVSGTLAKDYTRAIEEGNFGTICLPYGAQFIGAELYELVGKDDKGVYLGEVTILEAGVPYIFLATATELVAYKDGTTATEAGSANGLIGNFTNEFVVPTGNYILYKNTFIPADGVTNKLNANRAYLDLDAVQEGTPVQMPGRRYIGMSVQGENEATGFENIVAPEGQAIKAIVNGQLIIIRNGEKYNVQGQKL